MDSYIKQFKEISIFDIAAVGGKNSNQKKLQARNMARNVLLICGILSSLLYLAMSIFIAMQWKSYSSTSLIHGQHDLMAPVKTTRFLQTRLVEEKVLTVLHILPQPDHAFDLILPNISPSAHTAFYDVECFLALMLEEINNRKYNNSHQHGMRTIEVPVYVENKEP